MESKPTKSSLPKPIDGKPTEPSAPRAAYNVVSDTVIGLKVRKSDNRFQAIFIALSVLFMAGLGATLAAWNRNWNLPWFGGALIGSFAGLVGGFFVSGIWLMIYRAIQHIRGHHG